MTPFPRASLLPDALADAVAERVLAGGDGGPEELLADLLAAHPAHADAVLRLARQLIGAAAMLDGTFTRVRDDAPDRIGGHRVLRRLGEGAFGVVYLCAQERPFARELAIKVLRDGRGSERALRRFREEARVTGQLGHPGIVPVHEFGCDDRGRHYFTMRPVEGSDMQRILDLVFAGKDDWNETRALGVILKVCEAMAYAHSRGIIHRDLKPANVMVGRFGEVFVMDWGLARVLDRDDPHDLRLAPGGGAPMQTTPAERALVTMDGVVLGTPAYMPPEQAHGNLERLSPASDVYSIGAMLYHLLARQAPFAEACSGPQAVLDAVRAGPPRPLRRCNAAIPAELVAICDKAMARDPAQRYADTLAFAEDLRAYLEHRVVAAYETGAAAELRKWIQRNRALAGTIAAAFVILVAALVVSAALLLFAEAKADEAEQQRQLADQRAADVLSLSAARDLQQLVTRADALWPATAANIAAYEAWQRDARDLVEGHAGDPATKRRARPGLAEHRRQLEALKARGSPGPDPHFDNGDDAWWHAQLTQLVGDLEAFLDPATGLYGDGTDPRHGWGVARRLAVARTLAERSVRGAEAAARWRDAIAAIGDPDRSPRYGGLRLRPQLGLLPIGADPASGLWEFAHLPTGEPVARASDGTLELRAGCGLVFVLVPGGSFRMGAQAKDLAGPNHDPRARPEEGPVHEVVLDPFFLSKFEMTQDQWQRFAGRNPSFYGPETGAAGVWTTILHPVEQVSWEQATSTLGRLDLRLPTEAQWEFAARAGTDSPWWTGREAASLQGAANVADAYARQNGGPSSWPYENGLDDGRRLHAPVGSYRANGNGLHDTIGNVLELCRDGYGRYDLAVRPGDGERQGADPRSHMIRGGGYHLSPSSARSAFRTDVTPTYRDFAIGLRPARTLERD